MTHGTLTTMEQIGKILGALETVGAKSGEIVELEATITRADGTVEVLGVIARSEPFEPEEPDGP